jgi:hypothetical protein
MVYIRCDISFLHVSHDLYSCSLIHIVEQSLLDSISRPNVLGVSVDNEMHTLLELRETEFVFFRGCLLVEGFSPE